MKRILSFLVLAAIVILCSSLARAQCPEDPNDNGICDTLYVEIWPGDECLVPGEPHLVRFPIRVTHDLPNPEIDSVAAFQLPLCYTHTNPGSNCFLPSWYHEVGLYHCSHEVCVFRHLPDMDNPMEINWMLHLSETLTGREWDTRILDLSAGNNFWLALLPTGSQDQRFWEGSRVLLATMTFQLEDSTTICVDTCFWPPATRLMFSRSDAVAYIPRTNLPYCASISLLGLGDCNADCATDVADVVYLINYLYRDGAAPPLQFGDVNCDGVTEAGDVVFLINYLFRDGPEPDC